MCRSAKVKEKRLRCKKEAFQLLTHKVRQAVTLYLQAHGHPWNLRFHYAAFLCATAAGAVLFWQWQAALLLALAHYVLSSAGHFFFEKNHPGFYKRPWLGFFGGWSWFLLRTYELLTGRRLFLLKKLPR